MVEMEARKHNFRRRRPTAQIGLDRACAPAGTTSISLVVLVILLGMGRSPEYFGHLGARGDRR